jgi:hypothetical protein
MDSFFADWRALMAALLHWFAGGNPYGAYRGLNGVLYEAGYFAYPPPALLLAAPLAVLPWWVSGLLVQAAAIIGFERWARHTTGRSALVWLALFPPLLQGLQIGQTTLLALVALMLGELSYREGRDGRAGLLLALAALKPQIGALAIGFLLVEALRTRRWPMLGAFTLTSALLWGAAMIPGPQIYAQWLGGLHAYRAALPDRPMIFPPLGPVVALAAVALWRRREGDGFALALLINTLIYPLSVIYIVSPVAFVVIRWRRDWELWPLGLCWLVPVIFVQLPVTPTTWLAAIQAVVICGLGVGMMPRLRRPAVRGERRLVR